MWKKICVFIMVLAMVTLQVAAFSLTTSIAVAGTVTKATSGLASYGFAHLAELWKTSGMGSCQVPIIMYHSVADQTDPINSYVVTPDQFEEDLLYLQENGYTTILIGDLIDYVYSGGALPEKPILLTFDDGYADNYENMFPLLKKYQMKAVISSVMVHYDQVVENAMPRFTQTQAQEMVKSGLVEIQNHTYDLHKNDSRYGVLPHDEEDMKEFSAVLVEDIAKSQAAFARLELPPATTFTYPYGASNGAVLEIVKNNGYLASMVTAADYINVIERGNPESLYEMSRHNRPAQAETEAFFKTVEAAYQNP